MPIIVTESEFQKFRGELYNQFKHLADSAMDLLDALCSNHKTSSVVQLQQIANNPATQESSNRFKN